MAPLQLPTGRKLIVTSVALLSCISLIFVFQALNNRTQDLKAEIEQKKHRLEKYQGRLLLKDIVENERTTLRNAIVRAERSLLTGKTASLAAAEVQELLTNMANASSSRITSIRVLQPERGGKEEYLAIPIEVTINSSIRDLTRLLYKLEGSTKLLRVAKLGIRPVTGRGIPGSSVTLVTTMTVEGFVRKMDA